MVSAGAETDNSLHRRQLIRACLSIESELAASYSAAQRAVRAPNQRRGAGDFADSTLRGRPCVRRFSLLRAALCRDEIAALWFAADFLPGPN